MDIIDNDNFIKKYPLVFKKYIPLKKIGKGAFSEIFSAINIETKEKVALKLEKRNIKNKYLDTECYLLFSVKGLGIPKVLSFGHNKEYDILVMPLLGKSLQELYIYKNKNFEFKDICLIAIQILDRIQMIHFKKIIHRDIKPENFLIGINDPHIIYLIDFGLSKKYKSSKTGKHIKFVDVKKFTGTLRYGSINSLKLKEQSRRDDLESIGYMLIYLIKGSLPWMGIKVINKKESYMNLAKIKKDIEPEKLCQNLPIEFVEYIKYVRDLQFEENPDYSYLKSLFGRMLKKRGYNDKFINFSWVDETKIKENINIFNLTKKGSFSRERIYKKIKNDLEQKRSLSEGKNAMLFNSSNISYKNMANSNIKTEKKIEEQTNRNNNFLNNNNLNNKNTQINFVNNSINNNFISISVSFPNNAMFNNNNINQNFNMNKDKQIFTNLNNNGTFINLNKNIKYNNNKKKLYDKNNNIFQYQKHSPSYCRKDDININTNTSINFTKINNNFNSQDYNNYILANNNNIYNKTKKILKEKIFYQTKKIFYSTNNNSNTQKYFKIINNNNVNNNNRANNYKNIQIKNNQFYNSSNSSYNNLKEIKKNTYLITKNDLVKNKSNNNIKIIHKNKNDIKKNFLLNNNYNLNLKNKEILDINPYIKKAKSEYKTNTNNNLQNELNKFNLRYNNVEFLNDKRLLKNKIKRKISKKSPKNIKINQSAEHYKSNNLKNTIYKYKSTNSENICFIY